LKLTVYPFASGGTSGATHFLFDFAFFQHKNIIYIIKKGK
jgi:hypothetical protein